MGGRARRGGPVGVTRDMGCGTSNESQAAEISALKAENEKLKAQLSSGGTAAATPGQGDEKRSKGKRLSFAPPAGVDPLAEPLDEMPSPDSAAGDDMDFEIEDMDMPKKARMVAKRESKEGEDAISPGTK